MSLPKIGAILALDGEREYKAAITNINAAQRSLRSEMKLATEAFYGQENGIEALTKKQEIFEKQQESQKMKVAVCEQALKKYNQAQEEAGRKVEDAAANYKKATDRLKELESGTSGSTKEIQKQKKAVEEAKNNLEIANREYQTASKRGEEWKNSLNNASAELIKTDRALAENRTYLREAKKSTDQCATSIDEYGKKLKDAGEASDDFKQKTTNAITSLSAVLSSGKILEGIKDITGELKGCVDAASSFETAMAKVNTIANTKSVSLKTLSNDILSVSSSLGISAEQIAEATYNAISAGQKTEDAVQFAEKATKLSIGGFTDATTAVDILTTALNAYGLEVERAEEVSDMLVTTQNLGKTTVAELASTMGRVIPLASSYSVKMDNLSSAYAIMTANGIATAETTTYLKSMLGELGDSSKEVSKILQESTGKSFKQLSEEGYSLGDIMETLGESVDNDTTRFNELWSSSEAGIGALSILNSGSIKYNATLKQMKESAGATSTAYNKMADTAEMAETRMENSMQNLKIAVGEVLKPSIEETYEAGTDLTDWATEFVEMHPEVVRALAAMTVGFGTFAGALTIATTAMKAFEMIKALVNPTSLLVTAIAGLTASAFAYAAMAEKEESAIQKLNRGTLDLIKSSKELNKVQNESSESRKSSRKNMETEAAACQSLSRELVKLQEKTTLTASEQSRMQIIVSELNQTIPDLNLSIDDQTGKLNMSTEALLENVEAMNQLAIAAAAQEDLNRIAEEQYEQHKKLVELNQRLEEQTIAVSEAQKIYNEALEKTKETEDSRWLEADNSGYIDALEVQKQLQEQIEETQAAYDALGDEWIETSAYIANTEAQYSASDATRTLGDSAKDTGDKISTSSETIQKAFSDMGKSIRESVEEQIDIFSEYKEKNSVTSKELLQNMESQVKGVREWGDNLSELAGRADENGLLINEGLLKHLVDLGPEGAAYVQAFAEMTDEELKRANELWDESITLPDTIAEKFTETGFQMASGLSKGIEDNVPIVKKSMQNMVDDVIDAANIAAEIKSPSKKMINTGYWMDEGLAKGIKDKKPVVLASIKDVTSSVLNSAKSELSFSAGREIGLNFSEGLASGILAGKSKVISAAVEVAKAAVSSAREELDMHSPSRKTIAMGGDYMDGWVIGIRSKMENLKDAVRGSLSEALIQDVGSITDGNRDAGYSANHEGGSSAGNIQIIFQPQQMTNDELDRTFEYINERFGMEL